MERPHKQVRINVRMTADLREKYTNYCIKKDVMLSERVRQLIKMDMQGKIK